MFGLVPTQTPRRQKLPRILSKICTMPKDSVFKYSTRVKSLTTSSGLDWVARKHMIAKLISWTMPDFSDAQMRKAILLSVKNAVIFVR
jgi:hypothetical protein